MENTTSAGGGFLLGMPDAICAPERFSDEQQLIAQTAERFAQEEIAPACDAIESQDFEVIRRLLGRTGELGLSGVEVPEEYGGAGMDLTTASLVADHLAVQGSFSVTFGAHSGIGTLPLVHFGNAEQKARYLPKLAAGTWIAAYALSEAESGSDALAMRTTATAASDGSGYTLNGEKMWISNAGIADLFTVFAKLDGKVTAFLVEAKTPGLATGAEEHKMGIWGSSTRALLLRDAKVGEGNLLGQPGEGAHIAFQILNVGRIKLGAACIGGARNLIRQTIAYAKQRHAFGQAIASYGLVEQHFATMAIALYAAESAVYRTTGLMDTAASLEEHAAECAMVKITASEMMDRVADLAVQVHGGNGFVRGNPAERAYRDARVNRIFEGTNEINRLLASGVLLRRAQQGRLALMPAIQELQQSLLSPSAAAPAPLLERARQIVLLAIGAAARRHGEALAQEQETLAGLTDMAAGLYAMQSAWLRQPEGILTQAVLCEQMDELELAAHRLLAALCAGDELRTNLAWLRRLAKRDATDIVGLRRRIARALIAAGGYSPSLA